MFSMTRRHKCPKCQYSKSYLIRRSKHRCARCKYEWQPNRFPLRISASEWKSLLMHFFLNLPGRDIATETGIERKRVLRALLLVRQIMSEDIPHEFTEILSVDQTANGKLENNTPEPEKLQIDKQDRKPRKKPVFGILFKNAKAWAEIIPYTEADELILQIKQQVNHDSTLFSGKWQKYTVIASKDFFHRLSKHNKGKGNHINELEGFWGYLKRKLASKGGIRQDRLPLYLAEYVWRYNHRSLSPKEKIDHMLSLLKQFNSQNLFVA